MIYLLKAILCLLSFMGIGLLLATVARIAGFNEREKQRELDYEKSKRERRVRVLDMIDQSK